MGPIYVLHFYLVKNNKIANDLAATEARDKNKHQFGVLRILEKKIMHACLNIKFNFTLYNWAQISVDN